MTLNIVKNIIGNVASSYQVNRAIEIPNLNENYLSRLGICNAYLNIRHVVGSVLDWPEFFLGATRNMSGKFGIK